MIEPEDIHESPKPNYTPVLILGLAALLLMIVGFISYRDYVNHKADQRLAGSEERIKNLEEQIARISGPESSAAAPAEAKVPDQPARDPELEELRRQFEEMKQKMAANERKAQENTLKVDRVLASGPQVVQEPVSDIPGSPASSLPRPNDEIEVPEYVRESVAAPPQGQMSPAARERFENLQNKVRNAPSIGEVLSYNRDWGFVTFNAGSDNNVSEGDRFSVRRGAEILGIVKVKEVFPNQAIASLVTPTDKFADAANPQAGDEIILFDPF